MLIGQTAFSTRALRVAPLALCVLLALLLFADVSDQVRQIIGAIGFGLLAFLYKATAELTVGLTRAQQEQMTIASELKKQDELVRITDSELAALKDEFVTWKAENNEAMVQSEARATQLEADKVATIARLKADEDALTSLNEDLQRLLAAVKPSRRHRLYSDDQLLTLSLRTSSEGLIRGFGRPPTTLD
jgi:hypothetical protein